MKPLLTNDLLQVSERRSRLCSSNESSNLEDSDAGYLSPSFSSGKRQRARSLSCSPSKMHNESDIIQMQNEKFKEKFPKACTQMEENLQFFINSENGTLNSMNANIDAAARFILIQIIELAKSCLDKSKLSQLTCAYFDELTNSIEKLLNESRDKCELISIQILHNVVKKLLLIIARVARLLECIEFDPLEFCFWLNAAEIHAKNLVKTDIPKYIISKLGLNRDPLMEDFGPSETNLLDTNVKQDAVVSGNFKLHSGLPFRSIS
jgi:microtubule-associated serine/threonine kinase